MMNNKRRRRLGLPAQRQVVRQVRPPAANGGSIGYSLEHRQDMLALYNEGLPVRASISSINRWKIRIIPYAATGNKAVPKISGLNLYLLVVYRMIFPKATADEVRRYILENNPIHATLFSRTDIC